tara:strand:+ start:4464 stop:5171 length:708 start_codon:yes stop_codon:yes gene_type:complete
MKLKPEHPALAERRTIHTKKVFSVNTYSNSVIKPVSNNSKLGKGSNIITKGNWRGFAVFAVTLEERASCPPCEHEDDCYGNNAPFAHRFRSGKDLESRIQTEIAFLAKRYRFGFVVRLHILGDFYNLRYVALWQSLLKKHVNLHIYGYTAHDRNSVMGLRISLLNSCPGNRCWIRNSVARSNGYSMVATSILSESDIHCPEQTGKTDSCMTCGLCWAVNLPIHFATHKRKKEVTT